MAVSRFPERSTYPTAPAYGPRAVGSSVSMISMARIFGAPETVPWGNVARRTSTGPTPGRSLPETPDTRCITWEYRSTTMSSSTRTDPNSQTRPKSLRARSTSMTCSAVSFSSVRSSEARASSSSGVRPRGRVPAMGRLNTRPSRTRDMSSGEDPAST